MIINSKILKETKYHILVECVDCVNILPDFQLESGVIIKVKGYWQDDSKVKWDLFCSDYPEISKQVLMKAELQQLGVL